MTDTNDFYRQILINPSAASTLPAEESALLLLKGILVTLQQDSSPQAVAMLQDAVNFCSIPDIQNLALDILISLAQQSILAAQQSIFQLALLHQNQAAVQAIKLYKIESGQSETQSAFTFFFDNRANLLQIDPDLTYLTQFALSDLPDSIYSVIFSKAETLKLNHWIQIIRFILQPDIHDLSTLSDAYPTYTPSEKTLLLDLLQQKAALSVQAAGELLCRIFIDWEDTQAKNIAIEFGYEPDDPIQKALFLFLAEEWKRYARLDFNHALIILAYESARPAIRQRLLNLSRYSGQTEWMQKISSSTNTRWLRDMRDTDWELAILRLQKDHRYNDLWRLAKAAPPVWGALIIKLLFQIEWQPESLDNPEQWQELNGLAAQAVQSLPTLFLQQVFKTPSGSATCLSLSPLGDWLAVGGSDSQIALFNLSTLSPVPTMIASAPQTRALAFHPSSEQLAISSGDQRIRVVSVPQGRLLKTLEGHIGLVRSLLIHPDGRTLYSASFDGTLRSWRFPQGPELSILVNQKSEIFAQALSPDGSALMATRSSHAISVQDLPSGALIHSLTGHTATVTHLAASSSGQILASYGRDQVIRLWNYVSGKPLLSIPVPSEQVTALAIHPSEQIFSTGTFAGTLTIYLTSTGKDILTLSGIENPIVALAFTSDGNTIIGCSTEGEIYFWDIRIFMLIRNPLGEKNPLALDHDLSALANRGQLTQPEKIWLRFSQNLNHLRQNFDIQIEEIHPISIGEFDIEL